jgi:predicted DCC family thiol-disulfide oxidoreductase YuxK
MQQLPELSLMAGLLLLVPVQIRDSIYELVANNRYQWFGKTEECFIPDQSIRNKL